MTLDILKLSNVLTLAKTDPMHRRSDRSPSDERRSLASSQALGAVLEQPLLLMECTVALRREQGRRWATAGLSAQQLSSKRQLDRRQLHQWRVAPCQSGCCPDHARAQASPQVCQCCGGQAHESRCSVKASYHENPATNHLCQRILSMQARCYYTVG
jgi:hypothetical protein